MKATELIGGVHDAAQRESSGLLIGAHKIIRWSALSFGLLYGFFHNRTVQKRVAAVKAELAEKQRLQWIEEARREWKVKSEQGLSGWIKQLIE